MGISRGVRKRLLEASSNLTRTSTCEILGVEDTVLLRLTCLFARLKPTVLMANRAVFLVSAWLCNAYHNINEKQYGRLIM